MQTTEISLKNAPKVDAKGSVVTTEKKKREKKREEEMECDFYTYQ